MFKYHRALAQTRCAMGAGNPAAVLAAWAEAYTRLLETANTQGAFGMVVNMETHQPWTAAVAKHVNQPFPKEYQGAPRLIVPCVRSVVGKDEALQLKIIALLNKPVESVTVALYSSKTMPANGKRRRVSSRSGWAPVEEKYL